MSSDLGVARTLSLIAPSAVAAPSLEVEASSFDFLHALRASSASTKGASAISLHLDIERANERNRRHADEEETFSHEMAAAQDAAMIAINADRILRDAQERIELERAVAASQKKKQKQVRYVMADSDPLIKACKKGDHERVNELASQQDPADLREYVNARDKNGSTPIFHTVWPGHLEALRILLEHGADPNIQNNRQNTALHLACEREHQDLILTLVQYGASISLLNLNNQTCYQTVSDPQARSRVENFTKKCFHDMRRGHMAEQAFRLPKPSKRADFWEKKFYERDPFATAKAVEIATVASTLAEDSSLRLAVAPPNTSIQTNVTGVPPPTPFWTQFLHTSVGGEDALGIDAKKFTSQGMMERIAKQAKRELRAHGRKADESAAASEFTPHKTNPVVRRMQSASRRPTTASGAGPKRRKSTGDMHLPSIPPASVRDALASLSLYADVTDAHREYCQFLLLMNPIRLPVPMPLIGEMPHWLVEYVDEKQRLRDQQEEERQRRREEDRPKKTAAHEYALTRLRTAAFASATSPLFNAPMLTESRVAIPHAHQPDLVRPVVALLKDLTVHLPVSTVRPASTLSPTKRGLSASPSQRGMSASPSTRTIRQVTNPMSPSSLAGKGAASSSPASPPPTWDTMSIALDSEERMQIAKTKEYGNWVLRQLSALQQLAASQPGSGANTERQLERDGQAHAASPSLVDEHAMHIRDGSLTGLVDFEVERHLRQRYSGPGGLKEEDVAEEKEQHSKPFSLLDPPPVVARPSQKRATLSSFVAPPAPPSPRLNALAVEYMQQEKEGYLKGLYVQIHSVLSTLKKSATLHIAPDLARKLRKLNPSLLAALAPSSHTPSHLSGAGRLSSGGLRPSYSLLHFDAHAVQRSFENQLREMVDQRMRERREREEIERQIEGEEEQQQQQQQPNPEQPAPDAFQTPSRGGAKKARAASAAASRSLSRSGSAHALTASPSAASLSSSPSDSALSSAALQRALIAQYNPRILSPLSGGGSYERMGVPRQEFKLNMTTAAASKPSSFDDADASSDSARSVQVLEVHPPHPGSTFSSYRDLREASRNGRPATSGSSRPGTAAAGVSRPKTAEFSLARQPLEFPQQVEIAPNPLIANAAAAVHAVRQRSPERVRSSGGSTRSLQNSPSSQTDTFKAHNPTGRPTLFGHPSAQARPGTAAPAVDSRPTTGLRRSESASSFRSPHSAGTVRPLQGGSATPQQQLSDRSLYSPGFRSLTSSPSTAAASASPSPDAPMRSMTPSASMSSFASPSRVAAPVTPLFTGVDRAQVASMQHRTSLSARITNAVVVEDDQEATPARSPSGYLTGGSPTETSFLRRIKSQQSLAKSFKMVGRVTEGKPGVITSSAPATSPVNRPRTAAATRSLSRGASTSAHENAFTAGIPRSEDEAEEKQPASTTARPISPVPFIRTKAQSFAADTRIVAQSISGLDGAKVKMQPKLGYSLSAQSERPLAHDDADQPTQSKADADQEQQPSGPTTTANVLHPILNSGQNLNWTTSASKLTPLGDVGSSRPTSAVSAASRANVNRDKAIAKREKHAKHAPTTTTMTTTAASAEAAEDAITQELEAAMVGPAAAPVDLSSESAVHSAVPLSTPALDPDWHPHPGMDSGVGASGATYFLIPTAATSPAELPTRTLRATSATPKKATTTTPKGMRPTTAGPARAATEDASSFGGGGGSSWIFSSPSNVRPIYQSVLTGERSSPLAPVRRSPTRAFSLVGPSSARPAQAGVSFASFARPQAQLGLIAHQRPTTDRTP